MTITLRAARSDDEPFLLQVYASTRADEMAMVPWSVEQKQAFVQMQFDAQRKHYLQYYPGAEYFVIECDRLPIGRIIVDRSGSKILLMDIALLSEYRNTGIGSRLVRDYQSEAKQASKPLRLHVENFNRALQLYERLGFQKIAESGVYCEMEWCDDIRPD